jgi:restriction system protein
MAQYQRELERQARAQEQARLGAAREADRSRRAYERAAVAEEKERKRLYLDARLAEVDAKNEELETFVGQLEGLLAVTLDVDDFLDFAGLKTKPEIPPFNPGSLAISEPELDRSTFVPAPLAGIGKLVPGAKAKHAAAIEAAEARYRRALEERAAREEQRQAALADATRAHERDAAKRIARAEAQNAEVDAFQAKFEGGDPAAVVEYFSLVLDASQYPAGFPKHHRIAFVPESKQLVIEYQLPDFSIIPSVRQFKYVRSRDAIEASARPATQQKALYAGVVAQSTLRTIHEVFEADRGGRLETIVFNGYVETTDPATGRAVSPHLVTVRTTRELFNQLDLANVEPLACLKGLNASISRSPAELAPVRPVLEFNMVDPRFVQESDVLGTLDERPNLMALSPKEFESLITNLFEKMGLETRQTQPSRDGGVDCVAYDPRPIFGGKVVIQAKRYKNTVGVSAVRDLFGTMQNEGASKGILVTTSGYGKSSFQFADGKPLELLSGSNLLYLLAEHAGIEARIEPPDDWIDPQPDTEPLDTEMTGDLQAAAHQAATASVAIPPT